MNLLNIRRVLISFISYLCILYLKRLEGSLSTNIGALTKLRFLQLDNNLFTGRIPSEIGRATNLSKWMYNKHISKIDTSSFQKLLILFLFYFFEVNALFHDNSFQGDMPSELCTLLNTRNLTKLSTDCDEVNCSCDCICDGLI